MPIPIDAMIVVRGEAHVEDYPAVQAGLFRRRFPEWGRWGLSAMYAESDADVDDLGAGPRRRFPVLGLYRIADLEEAGFEVVPTFRTPHVTIAFTGELDDGLERLRTAIHEQRPNPYHGKGPDYGPGRGGTSEGREPSNHKGERHPAASAGTRVVRS